MTDQHPAETSGSEELEATKEQRDQRELDRVLDSGVTELPPNQIKGILGEKGLDVGKTDEFEPDLNSGISQEVDFPVIWMGIVFCLLTVVLAPLGLVLLWRTKGISQRARVLWTVIGVVWMIAAVPLLRGH